MSKQPQPSYGAILGAIGSKDGDGIKEPPKSDVKESKHPSSSTVVWQYDSGARTDVSFLELGAFAKVQFEVEDRRSGESLPRSMFIRSNGGQLFLITRTVWGNIECFSPQAGAGVPDGIDGWSQIEHFAGMQRCTASRYKMPSGMTNAGVIEFCTEVRKFSSHSGHTLNPLLLPPPELASRSPTDSIWNYAVIEGYQYNPVNDLGLVDTAVLVTTDEQPEDVRNNPEWTTEYSPGYGLGGMGN